MMMTVTKTSNSNKEKGRQATIPLHFWKTILITMMLLATIPTTYLLTRCVPESGKGGAVFTGSTKNRTRHNIFSPPSPQWWTMATAGTKRKANTPAAASGGGGKGTGGYEMPWVEKYRPRILDDVVGNDDTLVRLRAIAEDGNMPNLILCGPPGTGKVRSSVGRYPFSFFFRVVVVVVVVVSSFLFGIRWIVGGRRVVVVVVR